MESRIMEEQKIRDAIRDYLENFFVIRECPICETGQLAIWFTVDEKEKEDGQYIMGHRFRCIGCLGVFKGTEEEIGYIE